MKLKKNKKLSLLALIGGYTLGAAFLCLILSTGSKEIKIETTEKVIEFNNREPYQFAADKNTDEPIEKIKTTYIDRHVPSFTSNPNYNIIERQDHSVGVIPGYDDRLFVKTEKRINKIKNEYGFNNRSYSGGDNNDRSVVARNSGNLENFTTDILDRRLKEQSNNEVHTVKSGLSKRNELDREKSLDLSNLTVDREKDQGELGILPTDVNFNKKNKKYGETNAAGQLYSYNFPSRGIGAGIGSSGIGASGGSGAGIGAGIGESVLNGEVVPTLGGVGDAAKSGDKEAMSSQGAGGLLSGAGAGVAAGLAQGYMSEKPAAIGIGAGGGSSAGNGLNYEHLPKNASLHIMIHVDGSGSILNTRKQLEIMKETLLKNALLPYYNNDEDIYNKRVSIIDSAGERSLQFFVQAAKQDNVLAIAFQDEASPDYHLPNFNKAPQSAYSDDLDDLKVLLSEHKGLYRGIMFQVDRGKTFSKSFKEMVENAWNGEGYLSGENLKKYHRDENLFNIKNKQGIVFSDEYHAKSEGSAEYYMELILDGAKRIGVDLSLKGKGLTDGTLKSLD